VGGWAFLAACLTLLRGELGESPPASKSSVTKYIKCVAAS